jgi:hypothetical protein
MTSNLNAKHIDWNSRLTTTRGNSCVIRQELLSDLWAGLPNYKHFNHSDTPDVFDFVITRNLPFSVALASCSAVSSDHLPLIIDSGCRSSFYNQSDRLNVRHTDWAISQTQLETQIPLIPELHNAKDTDSCVENLSGAILGARTASTPKRRRKETQAP